MGSALDKAPALNTDQMRATHASRPRDRAQRVHPLLDFRHRVPPQRRTAQPQCLARKRWHRAARPPPETPMPAQGFDHSRKTLGLERCRPFLHGWRFNPRTCKTTERRLGDRCLKANAQHLRLFCHGGKLCCRPRTWRRRMQPADGPVPLATGACGAGP